MKRLWIAVSLAGLVLVAATEASAEGRLALHGAYNVPVSTQSIGSNVEFGAQYRFWGIFQFEGSLYTNIEYGASNIFNIKSISPIGLFSAGFGMKIPLGGFAVELGWNRFYTGLGDTAGVYHFSDSYRIGLAINLSDRFGVRVYSRSLYNFTDQTVTNSRFDITSATGRISTLGAGLVLHLL